MINIKTDSRKVKPGDIFVALKGISSNGEDYVDSAIENGASTIVVESDNKYEVKTIKVPSARNYLISYLKDNYSHLLNEMNIIGITGTNGKTTSAYLIYQMLNKLNKKCAYIGTIGFYIDEKVCSLPNTSPDICDLYDLIIQAYDSGCKNVVMEVSSQGLDMGRFESIKFNYAVFTNLTQDHLDYHKSMDNYAKAKRILFDNLTTDGVSILNSDSKYSKLFETNRSVDYGFNAKKYRVKNVCLGYSTRFELVIEGKTYNVCTKLIGEFNIYNLACSISTLAEMRINIDEIVRVIEYLNSPPGRMDIVNYKDNLIIIDYAHTPDAMKNVYETVVPICRGNIYTVFGCTGDRDRTKRPIMMDLALSNSKMSIVTSDDLHDESFSHIVKDMEEGITRKNYKVLESRLEAVKAGIDLLKSKDILLILGKGHEEYIIVKDKKIPFNDKQEVERIIREKVEV